MTGAQADAHVQLGGEVVGLLDGKIVVHFGSGIGPSQYSIWYDTEWHAVLSMETKEIAS